MQGVVGDKEGDLRELQDQFLTLPGFCGARESNTNFCCCMKVHTVREEFSNVVRLLNHCTG